MPSLDMFSARAAMMAARRRAFIVGSGRPSLAAVVISRASFPNSLDLTLSCRPLRCMMFLNWECPAMAHSSTAPFALLCARLRIARSGGERAIRIVLQDHLHRLRDEVEAVAALGEMTEAGPGQMVDESEHPLGREHVHGLDACLDALLRIDVEGDLHLRLLNENDVVHEVAGEKQRLAARIDHEAGMSDRVARRVHRLDAGNDLLAIVIENDAVAVRQQVLLGGDR